MTGLERFRLRLGGRVVLHDVTLRPAPGELLALCGPNGAGKTSILRALAGLVPGAAPPDPRRVAYLAQNPHAAWPMTVAQVVALGRIPHGDRAAAPVERAMLRCGIEGLRDARIDRISGGEARRAMLARVFATEPEMFLLDEPTASLDPDTADWVRGLLLDYRRATGATIFMSSHNMMEVERMCDEVVVMKQGAVVARGTPGALRTAYERDNLEEVFLDIARNP